MVARTKSAQMRKPRKHAFSVAEAQTNLDEVLDLALTSAKPVTIRSGRRFVVLQPMGISSEALPPYTINDDLAARLNSYPSDEFVPRPSQNRTGRKTTRK